MCLPREVLITYAEGLFCPRADEKVPPESESRQIGSGAVHL